MTRDNNCLNLFAESSARLAFREVLESDFDAWLRFCSYPDSLKYIMPQSTKSPEENCRDWFDKVKHRYENNLGVMNALIERESGLLVGQAGLLIQTVDDEDLMEISYSIMPEFRGKGYALEAAQKCRDFAFENDLSELLVSTIIKGNSASIQVAQRNGMKHIKSTVQRGDEIEVFGIHIRDWKK
jgi:[ribosomal protein S5]-alanine N-acetyltransferase